MVIAMIPIPFLVQLNQNRVDQMKFENGKNQIEKDR